MSAEDGLFLSLLKPALRVRGALRGALDLVFPPQAIDDVMTTGSTAKGCARGAEGRRRRAGGCRSGRPG